MLALNMGEFCVQKQYFFHLENLLILLMLDVTNITLTGSAMVNWNRRLLIQGVTTVSWYLLVQWATVLVNLVP